MAEETAGGASAALWRRALRVVPGGMYGHQNASALPAPFPRFMERGRGARVWDVDGHEYVDLLCSSVRSSWATTTRSSRPPPQHSAPWPIARTRRRRG